MTNSHYERMFDRLQYLDSRVQEDIVAYNRLLRYMKQNSPKCHDSESWQEVKDLEPYPLNDAY